MESKGANILQKNIDVNCNRDIRQFFSKGNGGATLTTNKRVISVIEPYINEINEDSYKLRERKIVNYKHKFNLEENEVDNSQSEAELLEEFEDEGLSAASEECFDVGLKNQKKLLSKKAKSNNKLKKKNSKKRKNTNGEENSDSSGENLYESDSDVEYIELRGQSTLHRVKAEAERTIRDAEVEIKKLEKEFYANEQKICETNSSYPEHCVPISADIRKFNFKALAEKQKELTGQLFDVIMIDPPWQLSSSQPTRGVAIAYDTLSDSIINEIPISKLQNDGFILIWTINAKFKVTLDLMKQWNYKYCDEVVWVKQTVNGKIAKGHGYYLQHTKETCLVGIKGNPKHMKNVFNDIIFSKRRGQSQKPEEIYERVEKLMPNGYYLEIFGRRNNLRDKWITIGNEL